ncbi:MAG: acyltransferase family protein [Plesiomonas sp.]
MSLIYRPDIQGLRAIAVLAVIVFHSHPAWLPGGYVGVDIFLVLSGFLITSILVNQKNQSDYYFKRALQYFYMSRIRRIAPAYFAMLAIVALVASVIFLPQDFKIFQQSLSKSAWFNANNYFATFGDYFAPANHEQPLLHTWSLAVEIQFYLIAPFLVLLLPVKVLKWLLWSCIILFTLLAEYKIRSLGAVQPAYYSLYARLPEFFAGALAALYANSIYQPASQPVSNRKAYIGFALILLAFVIQPNLGPFPGLLVLLPVTGVILILTCPANTKLNRFLSHPVLVFIGALSYSLYLWHWPVLALLRYVSGNSVLNFNLTLLFIFLTITLSLFSYYLIEQPLRSGLYKNKMSYGLLVLFISISAFTIERINRVLTPAPLPIAYQHYADPATICP